MWHGPGTQPGLACQKARAGPCRQVATEKLEPVQNAYHEVFVTRAGRQDWSIVQGTEASEDIRGKGQQSCAQRNKMRAPP